MKSPLKDKPLRNPGESSHIAFQDYLWEKVLSCLLIPLLFGYIAVLDWIRYLLELPIKPWLTTTIFVASVGIVLYKLYREIPVLKSMTLGRDGEKAVGQFLESLREQGAKIFHDIPGPNFNLDHIVISTTGIYVIETKTYSKPDRGTPGITFDGERVTLFGRGSFSEPVTQVKAGSRWLKEILKQSTGRDFPVRPVLVFPGWFVQPTVEARSSEVWVLNPKALPAFIQNSKVCMAGEDVNMTAFHLSRYIRNHRD